MSNYTSADVPESSRVVIDPVTRIEGHLRVEMEAGDGVIKMPGRPPRSTVALR